LYDEYCHVFVGNIFVNICKKTKSMLLGLDGISFWFDRSRVTLFLLLVLLTGISLVFIYSSSE
jgi:hypothetical protein